MSYPDLRFHGTSQEGNQKAIPHKRTSLALPGQLALPNVTNRLPVFSDTLQPCPNHLFYIVYGSDYTALNPAYSYFI